MSGASSTRRLMPLGYEKPPRSFNGNVQMVASAAHRRGVVIVRGETIVGSLEAAELCRLLRTAHEATRADDHAHAHVERLAHGITLRLGVQGAVNVSRSALNLIDGYAKRRAKAGTVQRASSSSLAKPGRCRGNPGRRGHEQRD